jgi:hypothetical protein
MDYEPQIHKLINKWLTDSDGSRSEARRLEQSDHIRYATSIAALEARSQAIDRCIADVESVVLHN